MVLIPGFQSTRLVTEGALEPFFFLYTDDSIQGNPETCKQSSIMLNYEVKNKKATSTLFVSTGTISVAFSVSGKINLSGIYPWYILSLSHHPDSCHSGWQ